MIPFILNVHCKPIQCHRNQINNYQGCGWEENEEWVVNKYRDSF